ncbi:MAG: 50S ribosomal protein L25 [Chloroflexota bacterium]
MKEVALKVTRREPGRRGAKDARTAGKVPGIYYVKGETPIPILSDPLSLRSIVYTGHTKLVRMEIEGESKSLNCVLKDVQFDPVTDALLHFDLIGLHEGQKINIEVPVVTRGVSEAVRTGGVLQQTMHKIAISCLPTNIPQAIEIDITGLKLGDSVHVRDLAYEGVEFEIPGDSLLVSVAGGRNTAADAAGEASKEG